MTGTIEAGSGLLPLAKANRVAAELQASDPDWKYKVIDCLNGLGRIDVYDENGDLVVSGFVPG